MKTQFDAFYEKARDLDLIFVSIFNTFREIILYKVEFIHL